MKASPTAWVFLAALALANLLALLALVGGTRSGQHRRYALRTGLVSGGVLVGGIAFGLAVLASGYRHFATAPPDQKAVLLAGSIAEAINCGALSLVGALLPIGATLFLVLSAPRKAEP